jgi:hypothetical protein
VRARNHLIRKGGPEAGIALLIAIFVLLLISVVAIALIVSSGTESALAGNYRSATSVYYAALAGLEEGRGRLSNQNPTSFNNTAPGFIPSPATLAVGQVRYIKNPLGGEDVLGVYPDTEYDQEFGAGALAAAYGAGTVQTTPSVSTVTSGGTTYNGPLYKWVRINAVSELSLRLDIDSNGTRDNNPIYYDTNQLKLTATPNNFQVLEITSLAVLQNGSQKLLQYLVAPSSQSLSFPSAFTILGTNTNFTGATDKQVQVEGIDQVSGGTCNPAQPTLPGIGVPSDAEVGYVINGGNGGTGIPVPNRGSYDGVSPASPAPAKPSVLNVFPTLPPSMQTPATLEGLIQLLVQGPDTVYLPGGSDSSRLPSQMSPSHPMMVVVGDNAPPVYGVTVGNGDFLLSNGATGYGLLVVTGTLSYTGDSGWKGIVLVVGQGRVVGSNAGTNEFDGAVLVARTRDSSGNLLPAFGQAELDLPAAGGNGIFYNSCRISDALPPIGAKILAFHEISQ